MFELLEFLFEEIADVVSDLFDSGADATAEAAAQATPPVAEVPVAEVGGGTSEWGALDGGISDRFDPKPPLGPGLA